MQNMHVDRDRRTLEAIGHIYCAAHHDDEKDPAGLCPECRTVIDATLERAAACPFGHEGNCQDCRVHCQRGEAREKIRTIMRYSAPRMAFRHPLMTIGYLRKKIAVKL